MYDNRVQERAVAALRHAQASRRAAAVTPHHQTRTREHAAAGGGGDDAATTTPVLLLRPPATPHAAPAGTGPSLVLPPPRPLARALSATPPGSPPRGPVRPEYLASAQRAAHETTGELRARWSMVYGRPASSYNITYLRQTVTTPGKDVGPRRQRPRMREAIAAANAAAATATATAGDAGDEAEGAVEEEDGRHSDDSAGGYSLYDSEEDPDEVPRLPLTADARAVVHRVVELSSSDEGEEVVEVSSSDMDSADERELAAMALRLRERRRVQRKAARASAEQDTGRA